MDIAGHNETSQGGSTFQDVSWQGLESLTDLTGTERIGAVILAAGLSQRMGRLKQLLPLEDKPLLQWVVELYHQVGIREIVVVSGHRAQEVSPAIERLGAVQAHNPLYKNGMFSSVLCGLRALPESLDAFFLHPVDLPLVRPLSVSWLLRSWRNSAEVLHPVWQGKTGHPPLIGNQWRREILNWSGENGLAGLWRHQTQGQRQVLVADRFITKDMDLPGDYKTMSALAPRWEILSREECLVLLREMLKLPEPLIAHCRAVARVCLILGQALNDSGAWLDLELLHSAALLHDLARGQSGHARLGAAWLREMGLCALSPLIDSHMELRPSQHDWLSEVEVLFLADKLVKGNQVVSLAQRFSAKQHAFADDSEASAAVTRRSHVAELLAKRFEAQTGQTIAHALLCLRSPD